MPAALFAAGLLGGPHRARPASPPVSAAVIAAGVEEAPVPDEPASPVSAHDPPSPASTVSPRLPDPFTVRRALRRAQRVGHLSTRAYEAHRRTYRTAREAAARLSGARRGELLAVLDEVRDLARARALTPSRMTAAFTLLARNTTFWTRAPFPNATTGGRVTFPGDPLIYRWYPGSGLQIQYLASWGRANAAARACQAKLRGQTCRAGELRRLVGRLVALGVPRRGGLVWESWFRFGGARPGWISAMTQGVAVQALARSAAVLGARHDLVLARRALWPFRVAPPAGVAVPAPGGRFYIMYSTQPSQRVLNGHLQAITGLRDAARLGAGRRAWRAFHRGDRAARAALGSFDTGAWALYSAGGREANLNYFLLMRDQLAGLCARTSARTYCRGDERFARYLREPPRIRLFVGTRLRPRRPARVRFTLSKISTVTVAVAARRGRLLVRRLQLPRGVHTVGWWPPRRGRYRVTVSAVGLSGHRAARSRTVVVRARHHAGHGRSRSAAPVGRRHRPTGG